MKNDNKILNNLEMAEQLLESICKIDQSIRLATKDKQTKAVVIEGLSSRFKFISEHFPHLSEDIQRRIVNYHSSKGNHVHVTDFIRLVEWYSMYLAEKPVEFWDSAGEYYGLRMNEVINMFLISKFQC